MRRPIFLSLAAVLLLAACGRGATGTAPAGNGAVHPPPDGAPRHFACVSTYLGRTASCMVLRDVDGATGEARLRQSCEADPGQHLTDSCPPAQLIGCCTVIGAEGFRSETCYYDTGLLDGSPAKCAASAGFWSTQP